MKAKEDTFFEHPPMTREETCSALVLALPSFLRRAPFCKPGMLYELIAIDVRAALFYTKLHSKTYVDSRHTIEEMRERQECKSLEGRQAEQLGLLEALRYEAFLSSDPLNHS